MIQVCAAFAKRFVASFLALALLAGAAEAQKPRAILLAIGIEAYELDHLNGLSYVAEDAIDVARALSQVANIDPARSRILVADRDWRGSQPMPEHVAGIAVEALAGIDRNTVLDTVEAFFAEVDAGGVGEVAPEELVFVYLGGHGEAQPNSDVGVSLLPSDFRENFTRDYSISTLTGEHENGPRLNNTIIILNMCKAGALPGQASGLSSRADLRKRIVALSQGSEQRHFVPASVSYQSTFEWEGHGSLLALALTDVLKYATEPDRSDITLGSLWKALGQQLETVQASFQTETGRNLDLTPVDLSDQLSDAAKKITIGQTNEFAAGQMQLMGEALSALAFDSPDARQVELHRLAARLFGRAAELSLNDLDRNRLWQGFSHLAANEAGAGAAFDAARRAAPDGSEVASVLPEFAIADAKPVLIFFKDTFFRGPIQRTDPDLRAWENTLGAMPGTERVLAVPWPEAPTGLDEAAMVSSIIQDAPPDAHVVFILSGRATETGELTRSSRDQNDPIEVINAVSFDDRNATLILDAPFGGQASARLRDPAGRGLSVLAAAGQSNGMTFGSVGTSARISTSSILRQSIKNGIGPETQADFNRAHRDALSKSAAQTLKDKNWEIGRMSWQRAAGDFHPFDASGGAFLNRRALDRFAHWSSFRLQGGVPVKLAARMDAALGVLANPGAGRAEGSIETYMKRVKNYDFSQWPMVAALASMQIGAITELMSDPGAGAQDALEFYGKGAELIDENKDLFDVDDPMLEALNKVPFRWREMSVSRIGSKTEQGFVRPLVISASDYVDPNIPDIGPPCFGAKRIIDLIEQQRVRGEVLLTRPQGDGVACPGGDAGMMRAVDGKTVLGQLKTFVDLSGKTDLLVVVITGRGAVIEGEAVIVLEQARVSDRSRLALARPVPLFPAFLGQEHYLRIADLMSHLERRNAVLILDSQFMPSAAQVPLLENRYVFPQTRLADFETTPPRPDLSSSDPERLLVVWSAGDTMLVPQTASRSPSTGQSLSSFLDRLLRAARVGRGSSYRQWIAAARNAPRQAWEAEPAIQASGQLDRLAFAAGADVRQLSDILAGKPRLRANITGAESVANAAKPNSDLGRLGRAAVLCAASELDPGFISLGQIERAAESLRNVDLEELPDDLLHSYSYWTAEIFDTCMNDPETALAIQERLVADERYPVEHADLLVRVATRTVQQAARKRMQSLLQQLPREAEDGLGAIVPQIRALEGGVVQ